MVRSISSIKTNNFSQLLRRGKNGTKIGLNATKHSLPAKVTLGLLGISGTDKFIGDQKINNSFLMNCSEYEICYDIKYA